jgi:hypothetical protein
VGRYDQLSEERSRAGKLRRVLEQRDLQKRSDDSWADFNKELGGMRKRDSYMKCREFRKVCNKLKNVSKLQVGKKI